MRTARVRRRLAVYLLLQHLDAPVDTGQFEVYLLLFAAERLDVLLDTGDGFVHKDAVREAVDNLLFLLVR